MKLSPARRVVYGAALLFAVHRPVQSVPRHRLVERARLVPAASRARARCCREGTWSLLFAFALMNLLVLLEVADRLSLKNDLEIAREIQQAMLPAACTARQASRRSA